MYGSNKSIVGCLLAFLLASGCATVAPESPNVCETAPDSIECICQAATNDQEELCQEDCATISGSNGCAQQCPDGTATDLVRKAIAGLSEGALDEGSNLVACALERYPSHNLASKMQRQLDLTPEVYFGTSRTTNYRIGQGDTLASIAQKCVKTRNNFHALAKLNGIIDPRSIRVGQIIRIPGQRPCMNVDQIIAEAESARNAGNLEEAYEAIDEARQLGNEGDVDQLYRNIAADYIEQLHTEAANLSSAGNCTAAKEIWNRILEIDRDEQLARNFLDTAGC